MQVHRMEDYRISHRVGRSNGTGQYFVNSRGNKKEVLAFAETYETHAGNFKPERWVEIMRECVAASGSEALLQRIIDHVKASCVWLKKARATKVKEDRGSMDDWDYEVPGQMELSDFIEMQEGGNDDD